LLCSLAFLGASIAGDPRDSLIALLLLLASAPAFLWLRSRHPRQKQGA
jgi:hypothetical protein